MQSHNIPANIIFSFPSFSILFSLRGWGGVAGGGRGSDLLVPPPPLLLLTSPTLFRIRICSESESHFRKGHTESGLPDFIQQSLPPPLVAAQKAVRCITPLTVTE